MFAIQVHIKADTPPMPDTVENPKELHFGRFIGANETAGLAIRQRACNGNSHRESTRLFTRRIELCVCSLKRGDAVFRL